MDKAFFEGEHDFRNKRYEVAIRHFSRVILLGRQREPLEQREASYEALGRWNDALKDAEELNRGNTTSWQNHARVARILHALGKHESALQSLNKAKELLSAKEGYKDLLDLQARVEKELEQQRLMAIEGCSYIGTLPPELLIDVFDIVVTDDEAMVVTIAAVCSHWRDLALSTPSLWTSVTLTDRKPIVKARLWNSRSSGMIKSLNIRKATSSAAVAMDRLVMGSLQSLTLGGINSSEVLLRPSLIPSFAQSLVSVDIYGTEDRGDLQELLKLPQFRWRYLRLYVSSIGWFRLARRCSELREFFYRGPCSDSWLGEVQQLLRDNTCLETLHLHFSTHGDRDRAVVTSSKSGPIYLPRLTDLSLQSSLGPLVDLQLILPMLHLGCLRKLRLSGLGLPNNTLQSLTAGGSFTRLLELEIDHCYAEDVVLIIQLLHTANDLEYLLINSLVRSWIVLEALSQRAQGGNAAAEFLCPRLLSVNLVDCSDIKRDAVLRLVESRRDFNSMSPSAVAKIESISLDCCVGLDDYILPRLRELVPRVYYKRAIMPRFSRYA